MKKFFVLFLLTTQAALADIVLYTDRPTARLQPIADQFTAETEIGRAHV